jgi:uncharacterized surface protein with fasciclin (FAS1) repeats
MGMINGCTPPPAPQEITPTLVEWLTETPNASRWLELIQASDLEFPTIETQDSFTFLVPTNESLSEIEDLDDWVKDVTRLNTLLKRHIIIGDIPLAQLAIQPYIQTQSNDESISSLFREGQTLIGGQNVTEGNFVIAQGRIHRIEGLILSTTEQIQNNPPSLADLLYADENRSTFYSLLQLTGLLPALNEGSFTLFAPSNDVFDALKEEIGQDQWDDLLGDLDVLMRVLSPHLKSGDPIDRETLQRTTILQLGQKEYDVVFSGDALTIGDVAVLDGEVSARNGLLYDVDGLWSQPQQQEQIIQQQDVLDLVSLLQTRSNLSVFMSMVDQGGLIQSLKDPGPFTLFVPTNAAFAGLIDTIGQDAYEEILLDPQTLIDLLNAHIVAGVSWPKSTLLQGGELTTLSDTIVFGSSDEGRLLLGQHVIQILESDVECTNGLVHVIDGVLSEALLLSNE